MLPRHQPGLRVLACLLSADINLDHNWVSLLGFFFLQSYHVSLSRKQISQGRDFGASCLFSVKTVKSTGGPACGTNGRGIQCWLQFSHSCYIYYMGFFFTEAIYIFTVYGLLFLLLIYLCINRYSFILRVIALYHFHILSGSDCSTAAACSFSVGQCPLVCQGTIHLWDGSQIK